MERYAWKAKIISGKNDEYIKRHNNIWPEMVELLKNAGICNYSIWMVDNEIFGYYECENGADFACKIQANSPIVDKWNEYMKDILLMEMDKDTGAQPRLEEVFYLK